MRGVPGTGGWLLQESIQAPLWRLRAPFRRLRSGFILRDLAAWVPLAQSCWLSLSSEARGPQSALGKGRKQELEGIA